MRLTAFTVTATSLTILASPVLAQSLRLGVAAGPSLVSGSTWPWTITSGSFDATGGARNGFFVGGQVTWGPLLHGVEVRGELFFNRLNGANSKRYLSPQTVPSAIHDDVLGAGGSLIFPILRTGRVTPYVIGGLGLHHTRLGLSPTARPPITETRSFTSPAFSAGVGLRLRGEPTAGLELRLFHTLNSPRGADFIPVTVSIAF
jgi:hypothetical protein